MPPTVRIVGLGASNLTRGITSLVALARALGGGDFEILAALGHGRSYGATSRVLVRTLPGILHCGLWRTLETLDDTRTRALVTDVGNDVLYGRSPGEILDWVEECVERLQARRAEVVLTGLPLANLDGLSPARFLFFRSLFVPTCRLSLAEVASRAERVDTSLAALAAARGLRFVHLRPEWYGADPVHFRRARRTAAWREILCGAAVGAPEGGARTLAAASFREALGLALTRPERQWLCGIPLRGARETRLPRGGSIRLF